MRRGKTRTLAHINAMDAVTTFFEHTALRLGPLGLPLGIVAAVLLFVMLLSFGQLGSEAGWVLTLTMLWSAGISMVVFWFMPRRSQQPHARSYGRWMQLYVTTFFLFWFAFVVLVTVVPLVGWLKYVG
jgi:hypothetical protein